MEVDQSDAGGSAATGSKQFNDLLGILNFDQRAHPREAILEINKGITNRTHISNSNSRNAKSLRTQASTPNFAATNLASQEY